MPADFGHSPIDIHKYSAGLKAEDQSNWVVFASAAQSSPVGVGKFSCNINENHLKKADTDIEG